MTLYELTDDKLIIDELYNLTYDEETGEVRELDYKDVEAMDLKTQELISKKTDSLIKYIKNIDSDMAVLKEEEKRLKARRERLDKKKEWLKSYIMQNMQKLGYKKVESAFGTLSQRKSKSTIINESIIPRDERYWSVKTEDKFDKKKIKELIESGEHIDGAMIQENISLIVK